MGLYSRPQSRLAEMLPRAVLVVGLLEMLAVSPRTLQQTSSPRLPPPAFRTAVDLMQLDVSVLDRNRRPVRGLTAADFTILEDGKPRNVQTLLEINIPPVSRANAVWESSQPRDVATNATVRDAKRIVVIVIDDASLVRLAARGESPTRRREGGIDRIGRPYYDARHGDGQACA